MLVILAVAWTLSFVGYSHAACWAIALGFGWAVADRHTV